MGIAIGLVLIHASPAAVFGAGLSAGLAEFPGMASGQYQSAPGDGVVAAVVCGAASTVGALLPVLPWLFLTGLAALWVSLGICFALCTLIAYSMPQRGWKAYVISYGITAIAIGLCFAGSFLPH